jgi:hypothetical protein
MAHAEICPVCNGKGTIEQNGATDPKTCHGCNGKGWVTVGEAKTPPSSAPWAPCETVRYPRPWDGVPRCDWRLRPWLVTYTTTGGTTSGYLGDSVGGGCNG